MKAKLNTILLAVALLVAPPSQAALNVLACEPEWGALAKELGGDKLNVFVATTARQDPHRIEARPSLIARARAADLLICTGAELEVGWLPLLQSQSGNPRIRSGQPGYFEAASFVARLDVPQRVDRSQGDVHPGGNPHIHLNPGNVDKVAQALGERLASLDGAEADFYRGRLKAFLERWRNAIAKWEKAGAPLRGMPIVVQHKDFAYLSQWLGLREVGVLEPKPGLPPTAAHLSALLAGLKKEPAKAVVRSAYQDPQASAWLSERAAIPALELAYTVGGTPAANDLFGLYDDTLARLLKVNR